MHMLFISFAPSIYDFQRDHYRCPIPSRVIMWHNGQMEITKRQQQIKLHMEETRTAALWFSFLTVRNPKHKHTKRNKQNRATILQYY